MTDTKSFINKEISLLNSICSQFEGAMKDSKSKAAFLTSLQERGWMHFPQFPVFDALHRPYLVYILIHKFRI